MRKLKAASAATADSGTELRRVEVNGVDYAYLHVDGRRSKDGATLFLLHGYPDDAYSWEHQITHFVRAGYRVIAPFLRGYAPTATPPDGYFDRATLALDVAALVDALNDGKPVDLVGQDWGAAVSYGVLGAFASKVRRCVILAVPHPVEIKRTLRRSPRHCLRSFHWFLFQLPWLPEGLIRGTRGQFLRLLWWLWSPRFRDRRHVDRVIASHLRGRGVEDALAYYRAATQQRYRDPALAALYRRLDQAVEVPTMVLCGEQDMRKDMLPRQGDLFTPEARYSWALVADAGHFLHREQPERVNALIERWLFDAESS